MKKIKTILPLILSLLAVTTILFALSPRVLADVVVEKASDEDQNKCYARYKNDDVAGSFTDWVQVPCDILITNGSSITEVWTNFAAEPEALTFKTATRCVASTTDYEHQCQTVWYISTQLGDQRLGDEIGIRHIDEVLSEYYPGQSLDEIIAGSDAKKPSLPIQRGGGGTTNPNSSVTEPIIEANTSYVPYDKLASTTADPEGIMKVLKVAVNILSGAVMVAAVIMLIIGAIQYSSAGGDPNGVKAAKTKITNVLIGVVAYVFLYAFMNWLIPGGLVTSI
jgi:hypothetical protein